MRQISFLKGSEVDIENPDMGFLSIHRVNTMPEEAGNRLWMSQAVQLAYYKIVYFSLKFLIKFE